jgi:signal transduction histidine kinase/CheY-like chemotaxis protein
MRNVPLRRKLLLLALVGILPLAATSGIGLYALVRQQQAQAQQSGRDITRALASTVDAALSESVSVLQTLATTGLLDDGRLQRFNARAQRVLASQPHWRLIHLDDPEARILAITAFRDPAEAPPLTELESFRQVVATHQPVIGHLSPGPGNVWGIPVRVPVMRNGKLLYVLTGVMKPDAFVEVVNRLRVPPEWVVSVFDAKGMRVARSRSHDKFLGMPASATLQRLMATSALEGAGISQSLEGETVYTAYTKSRVAGWSVAIGIPLHAIERGAYRSLAVFGGGILLSLGFAIGAALLIARGINRPIDELASATRNLGGDEPIAVPATDIREILHLAHALIASSEQTKEARQQAETASRAKDEFLAMLGHELRNPLAPIVTALHLMEMRGAGVMDRERQIIERQVGHLSRLVNDLLDISRITRGKIQLEYHQVDVRDVVQSALEMSQPALEGRERPPEIELPSEPLHVNGDATRLTQVLCNLIVNSARHTPPDGRIGIRARQAHDRIELEVQDSGSGIPPELLPRLFTIFTQGAQSIDRRAGGLGLGLAIVKALVELHGGSVRATSAGTGKGSTFVVSLPRDVRDVSRALAGPQRSDHAQHAARILVVDDNADAAQSLAMLLEAGGHEARTAPDGPSALTLMETWPPAIAVLDIGLPGMDGYALAEKIRSDPRHAGVKLVALTGYGRDADVARAKQAGFDLHVTKPAEPRQLLDAIGRLIG